MKRAVLGGGDESAAKRGRVEDHHKLLMVPQDNCGISWVDLVASARGITDNNISMFVDRLPEPSTLRYDDAQGYCAYLTAVIDSSAPRAVIVGQSGGMRYLLDAMTAHIADTSVCSTCMSALCPTSGEYAPPSLHRVRARHYRSRWSASVCFSDVEAP